MSHDYEFVEVFCDNDVAIVRLFTESSELECLEKTAAELNLLVENDGHRKVIVNLEKVELLQSSGLGVFVALDKKLAKLDGKLRLCNLRPYVVELFEMTGLDQVVDIQADVASAKKDF